MIKRVFQETYYIILAEKTKAERDCPLLSSGTRLEPRFSDFFFSGVYFHSITYLHSKKMTDSFVAKSIRNPTATRTKTPAEVGHPINTVASALKSVPVPEQVLNKSVQMNE